MTDSDTEYEVETTQLSLDILDIVSGRDGARLRDVVEKLGVAKSTAHKHLTTLRKNGFLTKRGDVYYVGLKFLNFGEQARSQWTEYQYIEETIGDLTARTEEECDFVAPDRGRVITIAESYHKWVKHRERAGADVSKEYRARIGSYYCMHATASGLAILATYSPSRVEEIIDRWGLPARTEHTITTREELYDELGGEGFAVEVEWPSADADRETVEKRRDLVENTREDVRHIVDIAGIDDPKRIDVVVTPDWKFEALGIAVESDADDLIPELMQEPAIRERGDAAADYGRDLQAEREALSLTLAPDAEYEALEAAAWLIEREFDAAVEVAVADGALADDARPGRPAIRID